MNTDIGFMFSCVVYVGYMMKKFVGETIEKKNFEEKVTSLWRYEGEKG